MATDAGSGGTYAVSGGTINVSGDWSPASISLSGSGTLNNNGSLSVTASSALLVTGGQLINAGTMTLPAFDASSFRGGAFNNRGTLNIASGVLTVPAGFLVSENGLLGADDSIAQLNVLGTLSHDSKLQAGLAFTVTGDATVAANGKIDVSRRGLAGYVGPNNEGAGQGYVWNGTQWVVSAAVGGTTTGGSHAGLGSGEYGQVAGAVYDVLEAPVLLGSGGGGSDVGNGSNGANGGGRVDLNVRGTLTLDGTLAANGGDAPAHCGGGAGGSVRLQVGRSRGCWQRCVPTAATVPARATAIASPCQLHDQDIHGHHAGGCLRHGRRRHAVYERDLERRRDQGYPGSHEGGKRGIRANYQLPVFLFTLISRACGT